MGSEKCEHLFQDELESCEDGLPIPVPRARPDHLDDAMLFGCGWLEQRHTCWAPTGTFKNCTEGQLKTFKRDLLVWVDAKKRIIRRFKLEGFPADDYFMTHGVHALPLEVDGMNSNVVLVSAVNHLPAGSVVELFVWDRPFPLPTKDAPGKIFTLHYVGRVQNDKIYTPNDIALFQYARNGHDYKLKLFATNDHYFKSGIMRQIEEIGSLPLSHFVECNLELSLKDKKLFETSCNVAASGIAYPNGIEVEEKSDGLHVYVGSSTGPAVYDYVARLPSRRDLISFLTWKTYAEIPMNFLVDNLSIAPKSRRLVVAGHPKAVEFLA